MIQPMSVAKCTRSPGWTSDWYAASRAIEARNPPCTGTAQRLVRDLLHAHEHAAPRRSFGRDQDLGFCVGEPSRDGGCAEAREDRDLHGPEVRAGVRRGGDERHHREEDADSVSRPDAE